MRFRRAGYEPSFDSAFVAWLDSHLPTDGTAPDAFLDADVTPLIVAQLPPTPGPIRIGISEGAPSVAASAGPA